MLHISYQRDIQRLHAGKETRKKSKTGSQSTKEEGKGYKESKERDVWSHFPCCVLFFRVSVQLQNT